MSVNDIVFVVLVILTVVWIVATFSAVALIRRFYEEERER